MPKKEVGTVGIFQTTAQRLEKFCHDENGNKVANKTAVASIAIDEYMDKHKK